MSRHRRRERIHTLTEKALEGYAGVRAECRRRLDQPPQPGDLFVLGQSAAPAVEWVVLDHDPDDPKRFLAVPADLNPLVGSADVAVPAEAAPGALSLRGAFVARLGVERFEPERRTGFLPPEQLAAIRRKRAEIEAGTLAGSISEQATDAEPEYRDWVREVLEPASAALHEAERRKEAPSRARRRRSAGVGRFRRTPTWDLRSRRYGLAASILLALTLGLFAGAEWQRRKSSPAARPLVNVPVALLGPAGTVRGEVPNLGVPRSASYFLVLIEVNTRYPAYRMEVRQRGADRDVWAGDGLIRISETELSVALPRREFPAGEYRLRLYGVTDGQADQLEDYALRIEVE